MYDVLIVGASLAGSATAIHLARRGRSVLLIDSAGFPRRKCCGEGLFPRGVDELADLGVLAALADASAPLTSVRFSLDGRSAEASIGDGARRALGVQRERLDGALLQCARQAGVEVRTGCKAGPLQRVDGRFGVEVAESRVIVAADGVRSALRRQAGLDAPVRDRRYGVSAHLRTPPPPTGRIDVRFERGYEVYLTPVGDGIVNAALLLDAKTAATLGGHLREGYLALLGDVGGGIGTCELLDEPLVGGPFPAAARAPWRDNLVLVGDAAGFFDGISGDGMTLALVSARQAAVAIDGMLTRGSTAPLYTYERDRRRLCRNATLLARLTLTLAAHRALGQRALTNLRRRPETFARLVAIGSGERPLRALRPRDLLALALGL